MSAKIISTGDGFTDRLNPDDLKLRRSALSRHIAQGEPFDCEYRIRAEKGDFNWIHERGHVERSEAGQPLRLIGILRIVTVHKQREVLLEQRANYDDLTGHFNKSRLREALEHAVAYSDRYDVGGGFIAVGVDKMAMINEAYGHDEADAVIIGVGQRLEEAVRTTDVIGRIGGDRFGVVLGNIDEAGLATTAEKILDCFRAEPIASAAGPIQMSVTIGGVLFPGLVQTSHDILACSENAMQEAKKQGRNCFLPYQMSEDQRIRQREYMMLGESVVKALREDRLVFAYQPVVDCQTAEVSYYETLIRMLDENGEVVPAQAFVPIVERLGLIRQMDRRTLEMALQDLTEDANIVLALNISGLTATDRTWLRALVGYIKHRPDIANRLIIEITETAALYDFEDCARFVAAVRDLGCQVALDDFGSGHTSFRHLKSLTVDIVK
ncbi:MAG: EAL domain-containing protein, partial [Alphaproteobacteria bacterium]